MTPLDWKLIGLALVSIAFLVVLVTRLKINGFVAILLASLLVGSGAVLLEQTVRNAAGERVPYTMLGVSKSIQDGLGATLGGIAAVLGVGSMLGKLLAESGGAEVLAKRFAAFFGPKRIQWCIMALALAVGLTTWFAVGLVLLLPILLTLTRETKQPFLLLTLPLLSCLSVMHGVMPPHPGPVVAIDALHANTGLVLFWGFIIGIPTAAVAGPLFALWAVNRVETHPPAEEKPAPTLSERVPPTFGLTLFSILLPVLLMLLATVAELCLPKGNPLRETSLFIGNPTNALLASFCFCLWSLGTRCGITLPELLKFSEGSVAAIGMSVLLVGGGGSFARVLRDSGIADSIGRLAQEMHLSPLLYGWMISAFIRVATGSATVAITTASALLVDVVAGHPELTQTHIALIIVAIGCGSLFLSHLNDAGFWIVKQSLGWTVEQTLRTWSVCETLVGLVGMGLALLCFQYV
jgi:GntP family gluconate:H+ symporter